MMFLDYIIRKVINLSGLYNPDYIVQRQKSYVFVEPLFWCISLLLNRHTMSVTICSNSKFNL